MLTGSFRPLSAALPASVAVVAAILSGLLASSLGGWDFYAVAAPAAAIVLISGWLVYYLHTRHHDAFSPLGIACFFYVQMFAIGGSYYAITNDAIYGKHPFTPDEVMWAMWVGALSLLAFSAGYLVNVLGVVSRVLPRLPATRAEGKFGTVAILLVLGWAARGQQFVSGKYLYGEFSSNTQSSGSTWIITVTASLPLVALGIVGARYYFAHRESRATMSMRVAYYALFMVEVIWTLPQGRRGDLVVLVVLALVLRYYGLRQRPTLVQAIVVLSVGLFFIVPVIYDLRNDPQYRSAPVATLQSVVVDWADEPVGAKVERGTTEVFDRFNVITSIAAIKHCNCDPPRAPGETLSWLLVSPLPRAIYPDKEDPGFFSGDFGTHYALSEANSSIAMTQTGEMVMNFGDDAYALFLVALAMAIVGGAYRVLADFLIARFTDPVILGVFAAVVFIDQENIIALSFVGLAKNVGFYVLLLYGIAWLQGSVGGRRTVTVSDRPAECTAA